MNTIAARPRYDRDYRRIEMKINARHNDGITVLELKGNIMGGEDETVFYEKLHELIDQDRKRIVLDLSRVEWINSRGLGILISGLSTMRNNGGDLKLAGVADKVKSLLTMTRLITAFDSHETVDDAIKSYS